MSYAGLRTKFAVRDYFRMYRTRRKQEITRQVPPSKQSRLTERGGGSCEDRSGGLQKYDTLHGVRRNAAAVPVPLHEHDARNPMGLLRYLPTVGANLQPGVPVRSQCVHAAVVLAAAPAVEARDSQLRRGPLAPLGNAQCINTSGCEIANPVPSHAVQQAVEMRRSGECVTQPAVGRHTRHPGVAEALTRKETRVRERVAPDDGYRKRPRKATVDVNHASVEGKAQVLAGVENNQILLQANKGKMSPVLDSRAPLKQAPASSSRGRRMAGEHTNWHVGSTAEMGTFVPVEDQSSGDSRHATGAADECADGEPVGGVGQQEASLRQDYESVLHPDQELEDPGTGPMWVPFNALAQQGYSNAAALRTGNTLSGLVGPLAATHYLPEKQRLPFPFMQLPALQQPAYLPSALLGGSAGLPALAMPLATAFLPWGLASAPGEFVNAFVGNLGQDAFRSTGAYRRYLTAAAAHAAGGAYL
ncbi:hypothetical protein VOLCADRAFT_93339 [Volvox carteri f. nagariensis]|uniref:Uncharacterized protein n=1 Tax=Volvox carteri f. nagariensis TaxID=3068 RepID=D8U1V9_VOLCA|nr:uncharacterized protein VOLCADRAFT_93339 [Volvox carteri f. nagariensis]EFJ46183.1 hypothetical protein VOLCADRAFT_93339 [Volvox carteri f. nagariensis]|eukprot:XP_002952630.1 hypothetical protein VOLCADRAFT_93339 [Volvox carteri f. nagariensis]